MHKLILQEIANRESKIDPKKILKFLIFPKRIDSYGLSWSVEVEVLFFTNHFLKKFNLIEAGERNQKRVT